MLMWLNYLVLRDKDWGVKLWCYHNNNGKDIPRQTHRPEPRAHVFATRPTFWPLVHLKRKKVIKDYGYRKKTSCRIGRDPDQEHPRTLPAGFRVGTATDTKVDVKLGERTAIGKSNVCTWNLLDKGNNSPMGKNGPGLTLWEEQRSDVQDVERQQLTRAINSGRVGGCQTQAWWSRPRR